MRTEKHCKDERNSSSIQGVTRSSHYRRPVNPFAVTRRSSSPRITYSDARYCPSKNNPQRRSWQSTVIIGFLITTVVCMSYSFRVKLQDEQKSLIRRLADDSPDSDFKDQSIVPVTDLSLPGRHITIVTTAAIPWFTGTAVNPLLRAAYLHRRVLEINGVENSAHRASDDMKDMTDPPRWVTLAVPWLESPDDQQLVYDQQFEDQSDQEDAIRGWLRDQADMPDAADPESGLRIVFYPSVYNTVVGSIFATGDMISFLEEESDIKMDVVIMEEPEHLNWFREPGSSWTEKFEYVVGIVHTNYPEYMALGGPGGSFVEPIMTMLSTVVLRAFCNRIIKLSPSLPVYAKQKEAIANVNGVRSEFLEIGVQRAALSKTVESKKGSESSNGIYFIGKLLWPKGLHQLLDLQEYYKGQTGNYFKVDIYGEGPDAVEIKKEFHDHLSSANVLTTAVDRALGSTEDESTDSFAVRFPGKVDHAELTNYKIFVNPSVTEVLCTATAEALAMGKFAIIPEHPSNSFFKRFPNCLSYSSESEFAAHLDYAMANEPEPLSPEITRDFTWEAAIDRLFEASAVTASHKVDVLQRDQHDEVDAWWLNCLGHALFDTWTASGEWVVRLKAKLLNGNAHTSNDKLRKRKQDDGIPSP